MSNFRLLFCLSIVIAISLPTRTAATALAPSHENENSVSVRFFPFIFGRAGDGDGRDHHASPEPKQNDEDHDDHDDHDHDDDDGDEATSPTPTPGSTSTNQTGDDEDNESCIDADALAHLSEEQLVYKEHRRAGVLCDATGSCATPGHVVVHHGVPMMMGSYCALEGVTCSKKVMLVNSPRMAWKLRIDSNTKGLQFTALSARYGSNAEEAVLGAAVRLGM